MRTVRRLYFYLTALISLEVVVWGVINLARTLFDVLPLGGVNLLAGGLSLVLVGVPIFGIHWAVVQRDARSDEEERTSRIRALFLYAARFGLLIPVVQNGLAILNRALMTWIGRGLDSPLVGSGQTLADNLAAVAVNLIAWAYIERVLRSDWQAAAPSGELPEVRRVYRYAWGIYSLGLAVFGCQQLFRFIFTTPEGLSDLTAAWLANGIALSAVGAPLFAHAWLVIRRGLDEHPNERRSLLRLGVLYALSWIALGLGLLSLGNLTASLMRWALGEANQLELWLNEKANWLAVMIIAGVVWAYFSRQRGQAVRDEDEIRRREGLERLYDSLLSLGGTVATFFSLWGLLSTITEILINQPATLGGLRDTLSYSLAGLAIGLPLWLRSWGRLQAQARAFGDEGDHARRSVVRKVYLYLLLFASVVGGMAAGVALFFLVLSAVLGSPDPNFWLEFARRAEVLALLLVWLSYHLGALRSDGRAAQQAVHERQALFPVLVIQAQGEEAFNEALSHALQQQAPRLPVTLFKLGVQAFSDEYYQTKAVLLPAALAADPPEALRLWLKEYQGQRVLIPLETEGWVWPGMPLRSPHELAVETARVVRQMAEGQPVRTAAPLTAWVIVGYVLAALFGLQMLFVLFSLGISLFGMY